MIGDIPTKGCHGMMSTVIHLDMIWVLCLNLEGKKSLPPIQTMTLIIIMTPKLGVVMGTTVIRDTKGPHGMMAVMTTLPVIITIDLETTIITEMIAVEKIMIMLAGVMILIMKGAV